MTSQVLRRPEFIHIFIELFVHVYGELGPTVGRYVLPYGDPREGGAAPCGLRVLVVWQCDVVNNRIGQGLE